MPMIYDDDPGIAWQHYCEQAEKSYKYLIEDKCCEDCRHCDVPDEGFYKDESVAYCLVAQEYIRTYNTPGEFECEDFEER